MFVGAVETYPLPAHGWTCFHCGETFTTIGSAQDHFGASPDREPGCVIRVKYGDERGLEMELRKSEARAQEAESRVIALEAELEGLEYSLRGQLEAFEKIAGGTVNDLRCRLDSMQGRVVTANTLIEGFRLRAPEILAEIVG